MSKVLSASDVFAAEDLASDLFPVPEWGGEILLKQMNAFTTTEMTKAVEANRELGMYVIIVFTAKNEDGSPMFTMDDVEKLKLKNFNLLNRLQRACLQLNSRGRDEIKNVLSEAPTGASPIDSQKN